MIFFGHLGLGAGLARSWTRAYPLSWLLVGTVLPDILDKPPFYAALYFPETMGRATEVFTCTRTFGHSGIPVAVLLAIAFATGSRKLIALILGVLTHLLLDLLGDGLDWYEESSTMLSLVFPFLGFRFAPRSLAPDSFTEHAVMSVTSWYKMGGEIAGLILLVNLWREERFDFRRHSRDPGRIIQGNDGYPDETP